MKIDWLQILRRTIQVMVMVLTVAIPILGLYEIMVSHYRGHLYMTRGELWGKGFYLIDEALRYINSNDPSRIIREVKGTFFWSFTIFGFNISDPLAFIGLLIGSRTFYLSLLTSTLVLVGITVILGRVYCGWVCPMHLIFELNNKLRGLLHRIRIRPINVGFNRLHKYTFLVIGSLSALILGVQFLALSYPPMILGREILHLIYFHSLGIGATVLIIILLFELSISQRAWCRYFCPGGAVWSLLGARRIVRVRLDSKLCDDCGKCTLACEFGLNPMRGEMGMECDNCGRCISKCKPGALRYSLILPGQNVKVERRNKGEGR